MFLECMRNSLETSTSSNCYFCFQKGGCTNQISEHRHMTIVNCNIHRNVMVTLILPQGVFSLSLDCVSVGILQNSFCPNSCFHDWENTVLGSWKSCYHRSLQVQLLWPHIRIQFELLEVARPFLQSGLGMRTAVVWAWVSGRHNRQGQLTYKQLRWC